MKNSVAREAKIITVLFKLIYHNKLCDMMMTATTMFHYIIMLALLGHDRRRDCACVCVFDSLQPDLTLPIKFVS